MNQNYRGLVNENQTGDRSNYSFWVYRSIPIFEVNKKGSAETDPKEK